MSLGKGMAFRQVSILTAVELLRQPITLLLTTSALVFIFLLPFVLTHNLGETGKLIRDSALAVIFLGSLLLAAPAACGAVRSEMQRGTAASVLSKPIGRGRFLLAKYAGVAMVMLLFIWMLSLAVLTAERMAEVPAIALKLLLIQIGTILIAYIIAGARNYMTKASFPSTAMLCLALLLTFSFLGSLGITTTEYVDPAGHGHSHGGEQKAPLDFFSGQKWTLLPACCLLAMAALMLQALALFCATRLRVVPTLTVCSLFFLLGLVTDYLFASRADDSWWASTAYTLLPNWQHFWLADALTSGGSIPWSYVGQTVVYSIAWIAGILLLAMGSFERMEVS